MRLTIVKRKRYKRKQRQKLLIIIFVVGPLIGIILGYIFTKHVVVPYWNTKEETVGQAQEKQETIKETTTSNNTNLDVIEMYSIEINRYKSLEEARDFIKKLNKDGRIGYISQGQEYIVYTALTFNKNEVNSQESIIKEKYSQAVVRSVKTAEKEVKIDISEESVFKDIKLTVVLLNSSYESELTMWLNDLKAIDYDGLKETIDKNNDILVKSMEKYSEVFKSENINNKELINLYNTLNKCIESRKKVSQELNNKNVEYITKTYYDFVESLFNYINYYNI